jgi:hypothetical protein
MIGDFTEYSNKQIHEARKSIQELDKKVSIMEEKFCKIMGIMKNNQVEKLKMKTSINQIQTTKDHNISR